MPISSGAASSSRLQAAAPSGSSKKFPRSTFGAGKTLTTTYTTNTSSNSNSNSNSRRGLHSRARSTSDLDNGANSERQDRPISRRPPANGAKSLVSEPKLISTSAKIDCATSRPIPLMPAGASSVAGHLQDTSARQKKRAIKHISRPSSLATTLRSSYEPIEATGAIGHRSLERVDFEGDDDDEDAGDPVASGTMNSIAGQLVVTGGMKPPPPPPAVAAATAAGAATTTQNNNNNNNSKPNNNNYLSNQFLIQNANKNSNQSDAQQQQFGKSSSVSKLTCPMYASRPAGHHHHLSATSLIQTNPSSASSSTAQLHSLSQLTHGGGGGGTHHQNNNHSTLNIKRTVNLKYVKTLIIALMGLDLMISVFVHQFSSHDELSLWWLWSPNTVRLRFSLLNLILSSIWFIVLVGAIIFDIYFILLIGCIVDVLSFVLLLAFSFVHFTQRIDYNSVNLTALLALLFSIIVLHVYLLVMASLTTYLMLAVRQRNKSTVRRRSNL